MIAAATQAPKRSPSPLRVARAIKSALDSENREVEDLASVSAAHRRKRPLIAHLPHELPSGTKAGGGWPHVHAITDLAVGRCLELESSLEELVVTLYYCNASVSRIETIVNALWGGEVDLAFIREQAGKVAERIRGWLRRPISGPYPCVFLTLILLNGGKGSTRALGRVVVATGVSRAGIREVLAIRLIAAADASAQRAFFGDLRDRGLDGTELFVGPNDPPLIEAVEKFFPGARYQADFAQMEREVLRAIPATEILETANALTAIRDDDSPVSAKEKLTSLLEELRRQRNIEAAGRVAVALPFLYNYSSFPRTHWPRLRTDNWSFVKAMRHSRRLIKTLGAETSPEDQLLILAAHWRRASREWARRKILWQSPAMERRVSGEKIRLWPV